MAEPQALTVVTVGPARIPRQEEPTIARQGRNSVPTPSPRVEEGDGAIPLLVIGIFNILQEQKDVLFLGNSVSLQNVINH